MTEPLYEKPIKKYRLIFIIFSVLACLAPIAAISIPWIPEGESVATWFQRSGSIVVFLSLFAESSALAIYNVLNPSGFVSVSFEDVEKKYGNLPSKYTRISLLLIGLGTIIWGYGNFLPFIT